MIAIIMIYSVYHNNYAGVVTAYVTVKAHNLGLKDNIVIINFRPFHPHPPYNVFHNGIYILFLYY